jgi:hypothetical protein
MISSPKVNDFVTTYPVAGSNLVEKPTNKDGKVWINKEQYFGGVPQTAWEFLYWRVPTDAKMVKGS